MVFYRCPFCDMTGHILQAWPPEDWYREHYPEGRPGDLVPMPCVFCYKKVRRGTIDLAGFELVPSIREWLQSEVPKPEDWALDLGSGLWTRAVAHGDREIELVIIGREFSLECAAVLIALADCSEQVAKRAVRFAEGSSPWPGGYAEPVLEQIVADSNTSPVSVRLDFEIQPPLPPIALSVFVEDVVPLRSEWEFV